MHAIDPGALEAFTVRVLVDLGTPEDLASDVARSLIEADRRGHTSHGVLRLPTYRAMIDDGILVPDAVPRVRSDDESVAVVDGQGAFGQVVGRFAVDVLTEKARERGLAGVGIRDATHLGRIGEWAERVTDEELCFLSFVHTSGGGLVVAPAGSTTRRFSTNPITLGVPTFDRLPFPLVLDMATSQVAHGKLDEYEADGRSLPEEWAVGSDGDPMTDPGEMGAFREGDTWGAIRPLGGTTAGHKGTGLAVMAELFAGLLGGGPVAGQRDPGAWFTNGAFFLAVDPTRYADREAMAAKVEALVEHVRAAESHPDVSVGGGARGEDLLLPGEAEYRTARDRESTGLALPDRTVADLVDLASERGLDHPFE